MIDEWYNNEIGKILNKYYDKDFSLCDIDGACRVFYYINNWITRLVIYESKHKNEKIEQPQLGTLYLLKEVINWNLLDKASGVFVIIHEDELGSFTQEIAQESILKIHKIINTSQTKKPYYELKYIKEMTIDNFYKWISAKDKRNG